MPDDNETKTIKDFLAVAAATGVPTLTVGANARTLVFDVHHGLQARRRTLGWDFAARFGSWAGYRAFAERLQAEGVFKAGASTHRFVHTVTGIQKVIGLDAETEAQAEGVKTRAKGALLKEMQRLERAQISASAATLPTRYSQGDASVQAFVRWCLKHYQALRRAGLVTCTREHLKAKPLEVIGDALRRCGLRQLGDGSRKTCTYAVALASISRMANYSRPRRQNWDFAQQKDNIDIYNPLLRKIETIPSDTAKITDGEIHKDMKPLPGYEALRTTVLESDPSRTRELLLESFAKADKGDEQAQEALAVYLMLPAVQALVGVAA